MPKAVADTPTLTVAPGRTYASKSAEDRRRARVWFLGTVDAPLDGIVDHCVALFMAAARA